MVDKRQACPLPSWVRRTIKLKNGCEIGSATARTVRHADYVSSWLEVLRGDNRAIVRAASQASKAADYLLSFLPSEDEAQAHVPSSLNFHRLESHPDLAHM